ncbi:MAG: hypothetical protein V4440_12225, partial [Pseudomonadota bacterium]
MPLQTIDRGTPGDPTDTFKVGVAFDTCQANDQYLEASKAPAFIINHSYDFAGTAPVIGRNYYLSKYLPDGPQKGGGNFIAKSGAIAPNGVTTFPSLTTNVYFERINVDEIDLYMAGAYGDGTNDDYFAWLRASVFFSSERGQITLEAGVYTCGTAIVIPFNIMVIFNKDAVIKPGSLLTFKSVQAHSGNDTGIDPSYTIGAVTDQVSFSYARVSGNSGAGGNLVSHNMDLVETDQDVLSNVKGSYARYSEIRCLGGAANGGFVGVGGFSFLLGSNSANNNAAIGSTFYAASLGVNCGGTMIDPKGALFASNMYVRADAGATFFINTTCCEFNTEHAAGTSVAYKTGIQIVQSFNDTVSGYNNDCA